MNGALVARGKKSEPYSRAWLRFERPMWSAPVLLLFFALPNVGYHSESSELLKKGESFPASHDSPFGRGSGEIVLKKGRKNSSGTAAGLFMR